MAARGPEPLHDASVGWCPVHEKQLYRTRRAARRAARRLHPGDHLSPYPCGERRWHLGHLPAVVLSGELPRSEIKSRNRARTKGGSTP